jgi:hypothetical protein
MTATLGEALAAYRRANGLPEDETRAASWTCRLGPVTLRLPNFAWRRGAISAHDLHHVLTGYPCTLGGECRMAAWEFGAGRMPHWAATAFCLPLLLLGLVRTPGRLWQAFRAGRRSRSLHQAAVTDALLALPLSAAQAEIAGGMAAGGTWSDYARFGLLILGATAIVLSPLAVLAGAWAALHLVIGV